MARHGWVKPLVDIHCQYGACDYPLVVRICFDNGVTRRYRDDDLHLPPPIFDRPERQNMVVGYQYRGRHKKAVTGSDDSKSRQRHYYDHLHYSRRK